MKNNQNKDGGIWNIIMTKIIKQLEHRKDVIQILVIDGSIRFNIIWCTPGPLPSSINK